MLDTAKEALALGDGVFFGDMGAAVGAAYRGLVITRGRLGFASRQQVSNDQNNTDDGNGDEESATHAQKSRRLRLCLQAVWLYRVHPRL